MAEVHSKYIHYNQDPTKPNITSCKVFYPRIPGILCLFFGNKERIQANQLKMSEYDEDKDEKRPSVHISRFREKLL